MYPYKWVGEADSNNTSGGRGSDLGSEWNSLTGLGGSLNGISDGLVAAEPDGAVHELTMDTWGKTSEQSGHTLLRTNLKDSLNHIGVFRSGALGSLLGLKTHFTGVDWDGTALGNTGGDCTEKHVFGQVD